MSRIRDLYRYIASVAVEFESPTTGGRTRATARDLSDLRNSEAAAEMPVRLLLPVSMLDGDEAQFATYGDGGAALQWRVTDLMLWRPLAQGMGLTDAAEDLVLYAGAYADAVVTMRNGLSSAAEDGPLDEGLYEVDLVTAAIRPGVFEFPRGSNRHYLGVECALTFEERLEPEG